MPVHRRPRPLLRLTLIGLLAATGATAMVAAGAAVVRFDQQPGPAATAELAADDRAERASRGDVRATEAASPTASLTPSATPTSAAPPTARAPVRTTTSKPAPLAVPSSCTGYAGNRQIGCALLSSFGFPISQMGPLDQLWTHESGWNHLATNPYSGAYGIPQALPGSKMGSVASDWRTNPATQITWGLGYISDRYGSPANAWAFWQANHWY